MYDLNSAGPKQLLVQAELCRNTPNSFATKHASHPDANCDPASKALRLGHVRDAVPMTWGPCPPQTGTQQNACRVGLMICRFCFTSGDLPFIASYALISRGKGKKKKNHKKIMASFAIKKIIFFTIRSHDQRQESAAEEYIGTQIWTHSIFVKVQSVRDCSQREQRRFGDKLTDPQYETR